MEKQRGFKDAFVPPAFAGIFGHNISYSLSPLIHYKFAEILTKKSGCTIPVLCYGKFDISPDEFHRAFQGFKSLNLKGANITQPYKTEVIKYLDSLTYEAKLIGAVNTVNRGNNGEYAGYNTDIEGFVQSVKRELSIKIEGINAVVLGAGGASRAVLYALIKEGAAKILIINRNKKKLLMLCEEMENWKNSLNKKSTEIFFMDFLDCRDRSNFLQDYFQATRLVVNCITPSFESFEMIRSMPLNCFKGGGYLSVMDISYNSESNRFLDLFEGIARKRVNGLPMLILQAIESFFIWTGSKIEYEAIKKELLKITVDFEQ